jgi:putative ATP-binding cassette transporter
VLVRRYFGRLISFGQVMADQSAFAQLVGSLSYFVQAYAGIGALIASINRLKALDDAVDFNRPRGISVEVGGAPEGVIVATRELKLRRPHGEPLLDVGEWTVRLGERWVVQGPSGAGKSTLLRAIAGLWPDGSGAVYMSDRRSAMLVPQRLYLPLGTLSDAVCFPDHAEQHEKAVVIDLLNRVGLSAHVHDMNEVRIWQEDLSPGEQQRIALARILLHRPNLIVLDEATSALDHDNACFFHETLLHELPGLTVISVVHDTTMLNYYTECLKIVDGRCTQSRIV